MTRTGWTAADRSGRREQLLVEIEQARLLRRSVLGTRGRLREQERLHRLNRLGF